jgi:Cutinase
VKIKKFAVASWPAQMQSGAQSDRNIFRRLPVTALILLFPALVLLFSAGLPVGTARAALSVPISPLASDYATLYNGGRLFTAQPPVTDINNGTCPAYILYAVRGSGENPGPKNRSLKELLGPRIEPVYKELQATVGTSLVGAVANTYPAVKVDGIALVTVHVDYPPSVVQGVVNAEADIIKIANDCPNSVFSLVGYSQGADVLRRALADLGKYDLVSQLHIYGTYFFGDPNFDPNEVAGSPKLVEHGDFNVASGITHQDNMIQNQTGDPIPAFPSTGLFHSYCDAYDVVCQGVAWGNGGATHVTYANKYAKGVAWRIAAPGGQFLKPIPLAYVARCQSGGRVDVDLNSWESYLPVPFAVYVDTVRVYRQTLPGAYWSPPIKVAVSGPSPLVEVDSSGSIIDQVKVRSSC